MTALRKIDAHLREIASVAEGLAPASREEQVLASWRRCLEDYKLNPERPAGPQIVPQRRLREHRQASEELIRMARFGMEALYRRVNALGYVLLLTDARGVAIDSMGDGALEQELRQTGLIEGSCWSEELTGTNGVGACLASDQAVTIHRDDHFDVTHTPLSCTAAPIHDAAGQMVGVLNLSHLNPPEGKHSQALALDILRACVRRIELAGLLKAHEGDWILRLGPSPEFLDVDPSGAIAVGADGRVTGATREAIELVTGTADSAELIGRRLEQALDCDTDSLPSLTRESAPHGRAVETGNGALIYAAAAAPPAPRRRAQKKTPAPLRELHGGDARMARIAEHAERVLDRNLSILLSGETGTGKEYVARAIHASRPRSGEFVAINCAALPEALIESELFGYAPGAFTGADARGRKGLIERANGGTLFLDEIGDMPLALQARLLRVLAEGEVQPVGAMKPVPVSLRVMSASHHDLAALIAQGRFRQDLYYRLNGLELDLPPVRERSDFDWLLARIIASGEAGLRFTPEALALLRRYDWPGNIREIANICTRCAALANGAPVGPEDLPRSILESTAKDETRAANNEAEALRALLAEHGGNISAAARAAGVDRSTLHRRMKKFGVHARG